MFTARTSLFAYSCIMLPVKVYYKYLVLLLSYTLFYAILKRKSNQCCHNTTSLTSELVVNSCIISHLTRLRHLEVVTFLEEQAINDTDSKTEQPLEPGMYSLYYVIFIVSANLRMIFVNLKENFTWKANKFRNLCVLKFLAILPLCSYIECITHHLA